MQFDKISFVSNFHDEIMCRIKSNNFWYIKTRFCNKNKRMFSFLPLINNSVTIGLDLLLLHILKIMLSNNGINIFRFIFANLATRCCSNVLATSLCTSQGRHRYVSNETPNDVSMQRGQDVY